ncbi:MAG TPA: protein kinase [Gemmatimonadales bacterium]|nr:protein kinase [Gemmatimonadales bacterium]
MIYCPHCGAQNEESFKFCKTCGADLSATLPLDAVVKPSPGHADAVEASELDLVRAELEEEYEIKEELGRGGMAIVFRAKEKQLDRDVAIKVLPFSLAFDKEFVERFQREARTSAKLEHPNIIPIYRVGKSGRVIFFVMKFLRGKPLSALLAARGALPPMEIRQILIQVGRALAYAHNSGVVHRDIKPDNIMFDEHGQALLTDFGIAKAGTSSKLTGTGMSIGTPHYMSPEQARAQPLDGRSDIYSLGVVAYQCLTGLVPYDGEDSFSIGYKHIMEELPVPMLETDEQRELFEVIRKMMAKLQTERFQTADEMVEVLERGSGFVATGISTAQTRAMPSLGGGVPKLSTAPTTPLPRFSAGLPPVPEGRPPRSAAAGLLIWLLAMGAVLGGGGYFAYKKGLIFAQAPADTTALARADSLRIAGDSGPGSHVDSMAGGMGDSAVKTAGPGGTGGPAVTPGTPGRLVLQGAFPADAHVTMDGQTVRGNQLDLPPGTHKLAVRAAGYVTYERAVLVAPGSIATVAVTLQRSRLVGDTVAPPGGGAASSCDQFGPTYNQDNACFDTRPAPLTAPYVLLAPDATETPRLAILLVKVSREGETLEARVFVGSNVTTFTNAALDLAKGLRWNPAQKNGEAVDAWTQLQVLPQRP